MRRASGQVEMGMQPQKPAIASPLLIPPPRPAQSYGQPPCTVSLPTHTPYPSKLQQRYSNDWTQSQCCTDKVERSTVSGASNALTRPPGWGKLIAAFFSCRLCMPTCEAQRLPACEGALATQSSETRIYGAGKATPECAAPSKFPAHCNRACVQSAHLRLLRPQQGHHLPARKPPFIALSERGPSKRYFLP